MEFKKYIAESLVGIREIICAREKQAYDMKTVLPSEKRGAELYEKYYSSERVDLRALKALEEAYVSSSSFKELEDIVSGIYKAASNRGLEDVYEVGIYKTRIKNKYI